jgi:signal peptidase I
MRSSIAAAIAFGIAVAGCSGEDQRSERLLGMPNASMEPTIHCAEPGSGCTADHEDRLRVELDGSPERGDIIAFEVPQAAEACGALPGSLYIKRVVGMPGETWAERHGYVFINGRRLREPYVEAQRRDSDTILPITVPARSYFVLGDNRVQSCDSRLWGFVPAKNLRGRVVEIVREDESIAPE